MQDDDNTQPGSSWNAIMQYAFLRIFANDGRLDANELAMLERLAMADGQIDEHERRTLATVLARAEVGASEEVHESIAAFRERYAIP